MDAANDDNSKIHLLDTRMASLFAKGHLKHSVSVPVVDENGNFQPEKLDALADYAKKNYMNDDQPIYILCNSGNRLAKTAVSLMMDVGISLDRLFIIEGGAKDPIIAANLVIESTPVVPTTPTDKPDSGQTGTTTNTKPAATTKTAAKTPKTGDSASPMGYMLMMAAAAGGIAGAAG